MVSVCEDLKPIHQILGNIENYY
eukprot:COSAG01_NODE_53096_length_341_cov_1.504132_1_plen_22_part_10